MRLHTVVRPEIIILRHLVALLTLATLLVLLVLAGTHQQHNAQLHVYTAAEQKAWTLIVDGKLVIFNKREETDYESEGSAVIAADLGHHRYLALTAGHVASLIDTTVVVYHHHDLKPLVLISYSDPHMDDLAAYILYSKKPLPVAPLATQPPAFQAPITVVGNPYSHYWSRNSGIYRGWAIHDHETMASNLVDVVTSHSDSIVCTGCDHGDSGGGIYDQSGRLIGIMADALALPEYASAAKFEDQTGIYDSTIVHRGLIINLHEIRWFIDYVKGDYTAWLDRQPHQALN